MRDHHEALTFGSVCSGIEAASVAWGPLGWHAAWFSEIDPFASAVLAHHYPKVPNLGDMTRLAAWIRAGLVEAPDILCGGTPCQAFSVAGLRKSLGDARGNLSLTFCEIANAIDDRRDIPTIVFWENVPGVLSTSDNAFGCFLAGLAGEDEPLVAPGGKWSHAGAVVGPRRTIAWRTLDAQYAGLAQRRKRVFVVASAREDFDPIAVLLEFDGVRRDIAPSREAREETAPTIAGGARKRGGYSHDDIPATVATLDASFGRLQGTSGQDANHGHSHLVAFGGNNCSGSVSVAAALNAAGGSGRMDFETETFVTHSLRGEGFDASEDGTGRGTPLVACAHVDLMPTMTAGGPAETSHNQVSGQMREQYIVPVLPFDTTQVTSAINRSQPRAGDPCHPLAAGAHPPAIAFDSRQDCVSSEHLFGSLGSSSPQAQAVVSCMQVRRLTPTECERLQGFPDNYTRIPNWSGWRPMDVDETPEQCIADGLEVKQNRKTMKWRVKDVDGPRYKALGNSWAVPVVRWIGARIARAIQ